MRSLAKAAIACVAIALAFVLGMHVREDNFPVATVAPAPTLAGSRIQYPAGRYPVLTSPDGTRHVVKSLLDVRRPIRFGDYVWNDRGVPAGPVWIRIDLAHQTLSVFRAGHEIGSSVILFGTDGKPTPTGVFPVLAKAQTHQSSLYDAPMPYMLRLTGDGVAVHASNVRQGSATHGCIGIPFSFAGLVYGQIRVGDRVDILPVKTTA